MYYTLFRIECIDIALPCDLCVYNNSSLVICFAHVTHVLL